MSHDTRDRAHLEAQTPVAVYYRCSSKQQELSVADQRREVVAFCERKNYSVVREYVDEGKSASKSPEKRVAFNQMISDSARGEFQIVVCYDASRFTRFDNIEGSAPKQILRTNGVFLDTLKEGEFDWRTTEGRWKDMAFCEANKAHSLNVSRDSIRGRVNLLKLGQGYWPSGVVPFGYDREYTDGVRTVRVGRVERYSKGKGWHLRLVVNEAEAAVVREIFDLFVNKLWARRQIGIHLTEKKVTLPDWVGGKSNGTWDEQNVARILRQKAYIGVAVLGGKGFGQPARHNKIEPVEQANACPVIVENHIWQEAREIAQRRRDGSRKPQPGRGGILSGFLVCGHCGYRLAKSEVKGKTKFWCITWERRPTMLTCKKWGVYEADLLPRVLEWLVESVDAELIQRIQAEPPGEDGQSTDERLLAEQLASLTDKVKGATESALLAPPAAREQAWAMVAQWQEEMDAVRQRLELIRAVRNAPEFDGFAAWWEGMKEQLVWVDVTEAHKAAGFEPGGLVPAGASCIGNPSAIVAPVPKDSLRGLLSRLGFVARLWWEEAGPRFRMRESLHRVKDVQIEASIPVDIIPPSKATPRCPRR